MKFAEGEREKRGFEVHIPLKLQLCKCKHYREIHTFFSSVLAYIPPVIQLSRMEQEGRFYPVPLAPHWQSHTGLFECQHGAFPAGEEQMQNGGGSQDATGRSEVASTLSSGRLSQGVG